MLKKWIARIFMILVAGTGLYLGVRWGLDEFAIRPVDGKLSYATTLNGLQTGSLGRFQITWDPANGGSLTIRAKENPNKVVWASLPGASFISAAQGRETVSENRAMYSFNDERQVTCADQHIRELRFEREEISVQGELTCDAGRAPLGYSLEFRQAADAQLGFKIILADPAYNRVYLNYASDPDEHFFGFGEQFSYFDLKGQRVPLFTSEQGVGRGAQPITAGANLQAGAGGSAFTTYIPMPYYITSRMRSLLLETTVYSVFDLRRGERVQIQVWANGMGGRILLGDTPAELIGAYTAFTGRMKPLPDWILNGAIIGMQGGSERVRQVWEQLRAAGTPTAAFWLQDWVGHRVTSFGKQLWWNWVLDEERYPGWAQLVSDLKAQKINVMVYASPFLVDAAQKPGVRRNLFQEAEKAGYLVKNAAGKPYLVQNTDFSAGMVDLTHPAAVAWFQGVLKDNLLGIGASGWMADFGEGLPYDAVLFDGRSGAAYHNQYPVDWAKLNRQVVDQAQSEAVFFTRAGYTSSPAYSTLFWEGDQMVTWDAQDGLKSALTGLLSGGVSGLAYNHSDIGGYTTITNPLMNYHRSKELLLRWMEFSAFTSVYRTHEGNRPEENVQFYSDAETLAQFTRMAKIYQGWGFYRRELVDAAARTGLPVARAMFLQYPNDPRFWSNDCRQYMLGSELLVAPVLDEGAQQVNVALPIGRWVHLWSGKVYDSVAPGASVTVAAPLGMPAIFYPEGSAVGQRFGKNLKELGLMP